MTPLEKTYNAALGALCRQIDDMQAQIELLLNRPTWERVQYLERQLAEAQKAARKPRRFGRAPPGE